MSKKRKSKAKKPDNKPASRFERIKKAVIDALPVRRWQRRIVYAGASLSLLLVIFIAGSVVAFRDQTMPNSYVAGVDLSRMNEKQLQSTLEQKISDTTLMLKYQDQNKSVKLGELAPEVDYAILNSKLVKHAVTDYFTWFMRRQEPLPISLDQAKVGEATADFSDADFKEPVPASFKYENDEFKIIGGKAGFGLSKSAIADIIAEQLRNELADTSVVLKPQEIAPSVTEDDIASQKDAIQKRVNQKYSLAWNDKDYSPTKETIAGWLVVVNHDTVSLTVKEKVVSSYLADVSARINTAPVNRQVVKYISGRPSYVETDGMTGVKVSNAAEAEKELIAAVGNAKSLKFELKTDTVAYQTNTRVIDDSSARTYTYDVAVWGNVSADLATFKSLANATLNDSRGWASGGLAFREVASGGNFTLVLAQPERVGGFSSICSNYYSCRVGRYVIINEDRWLGATPAWNDAGGSLRDYRHMVINHETGHWLGFSHSYCGGSGQLAPVMQQQSISLQGCKFNPWPLTSEIAKL